MGVVLLLFLRYLIYISLAVKLLKARDLTPRS